MNELLNDLSMAEQFLGCWSIVATLCAIYYHTRYKKVASACEGVSMLLCDVVVGDVKPKFNGEIYELEGENGLQFQFKRNPKNVVEVD
jgi:hypothetical protein